MNKILFLITFFCNSAFAFDYEVKSTLKVFPEVVRVAECILNSQEFKDEVSSIKEFTSSKDSGIQVVEKMKSDKKVFIRTYRTWNPKSSTIAYREGIEVYYNLWKINKSDMSEKAATLIHESSHVVGYGHDFKYNKKRQYSVPYMLGTIAEKHSKKCLEVL